MTSTSSSSTCTCGSKKSYDNCCGPYIRGEKKAPTAEALMRSRYAAYTKVVIDHIERTHAPQARHDFDRAAATTWAEKTDWKGLEIKATEGGGENDTEGTVEFVASFVPKIEGVPEELQTHHELSYFQKIDGEWFYVDGKTVRVPVTRNAPKLGRNDPCHCGSGKKFKKCHGA